MTPDSLPTVVTAFEAKVPDFIAQMSVDFTLEAMVTTEAIVSMVIALVKDQAPELPDDILERELSELEGVDTLRDPRVEIWPEPAKKFVEEYNFTERSLPGAPGVATTTEWVAEGDSVILLYQNMYQMFIS